MPHPYRSYDYEVRQKRLHNVSYARVILAVGFAATALVSCSGGLAIGKASNGDLTAETTVTTSVTVTEQAEAAAPVTITKTRQVTVSPSLEATFSEGVWLVGEDISPGRYRTTQAVSEECYWEISRPGTTTIIDNDFVTGGRPTVTLRRGQQFTTRRCGDWTRT